MRPEFIAIMNAVFPVFLRMNTSEISFDEGKVQSVPKRFSAEHVAYFRKIFVETAAVCFPRMFPDKDAAYIEMMVAKTAELLELPQARVN